MCFLCIFTKYYQLELLQNQKWVCDNESLVENNTDCTTIEELLLEIMIDNLGTKHKIPYVLQANWDVLTKLMAMSQGRRSLHIV